MFEYVLNTGFAQPYEMSNIIILFFIVLTYFNYSVEIVGNFKIISPVNVLEVLKPAAHRKMGSAAKKVIITGLTNPTIADACGVTHVVHRSWNHIHLH